jgi:WD40 repeat protein
MGNRAITSENLDVAFCPDGQRLATGTVDRNHTDMACANGSGDFDLARPHTKAVGSVRFSADGHWLVSASADQTICHWDATPMPE